MKRFNDILIERRKELKLTQKELATKLNISDKVISKWETGVSYPDLTMINQLANALEITINELLSAPEFNENTNNTIDNNNNENILLSYKISFIISISLAIASILLAILALLLENNNLRVIILVISILLLILSITISLIKNVKYKQLKDDKETSRIYLICNFISLDIYSIILIFLTVLNSKSITSKLAFIVLFILIILKIKLMKRLNYRFINVVYKIAFLLVCAVFIVSFLLLSNINFNMKIYVSIISVNWTIQVLVFYFVKN